MNDFMSNKRYDDGNKLSILQYARHLTGRTLRELGVDVTREGQGVHAKGLFGQVLETGYFDIENNSSPEPDFVKVGLELKTSPIIERAGRQVSKERLVLSIINYLDVPKKGWEGIFLHKDKNLLLIFFLWEQNVDFYDYRILKTVDWTYPEADLRIIYEDWQIIEKMITEGRADELSERQTRYLAACPKGVGHNGDMRPQPFSNKPAKQRALSLKSSYMTRVYCESTDVGDVLGPTDVIDIQPIVAINWDVSMTFEQYVVSRFSQFIGRTCDEIQRMLGIEDMSQQSKSYYAMMACRMMGVRTKRVEEFEKASIKMKIIRLRVNGNSKESMSFPAFDFRELVKQTWEDSDFYEQIDHRFFFPVFQLQKDDDEDRSLAIFRGAFFWSLPQRDFDEAQSLWEKVKATIVANDAETINSVMRVGKAFHVRPHALNSDDCLPLPNGTMVVKKCFWFSSGYLNQIVHDNLFVKN